ncbi:MAG: glycosyltransferase [Bacteroidetes bacterium]|nr:glycosyltransferase [Bacteroidota bacterium]HET6245923.1 glycosyltransferase [Bacteroidia bacterium]
MGLKISFFGSSLASFNRNTAAPYYKGIVNALNKNGHKIIFYEQETYRGPAFTDKEKSDWANRVFYQSKKSALLDILSIGSKADLLVKISGEGMFDKELERKVIQIRKQGQRIVFWDVDVKTTLERLQKDPNDQLIKLIPEYDIVFTNGGGQAVIDAYKKLGAKHCIPVYNAVDPETHFPSKPNPVYDCDLSYMGNRLQESEEMIEEFFFKPATLMTEKSFIIGGKGWENKPLRKNIKYAGDMTENFQNVLNSTPLTVLNIGKEESNNTSYSPSSAIFEAAGAGACIITDNLEGINSFFEPGREILLAENGQQVASILDELAPAVAKKIGQAALRKVLAHHTYAHRAKEIEKTLDF